MSQNFPVNQEKFCKDCAATISSRAEICPQCGIRQLAVPNPMGVVAPNGKNKLAAGLLAFFVGAFGIHKFYLGRTGAGILYLLLFWTVIPAILSIYDAIILLTMNDERFIEEYGRD